jgi:FdhD protein
MVRAFCRFLAGLVGQRPKPSDLHESKILLPRESLKVNSQVRKVDITRSGGESVSDAVAVEDPLEIRIGEFPLAVTMRTPGDDEDLVTGFLLTEGVILEPGEVTSIEHLDDSRVVVTLREGIELDMDQFKRNMFVSSSCGVCGKASIEQVEIMARPAKPFKVDQTVVSALTGRLRIAQPTFDETGGLHAAGVYDLTGEPLAVREDVGRHNAVDKAIGASARTQWPLPPSLLVVSGRQSFEIVQKAALAGIGGVVGVSAPSSLAVDLAEKLGMLLVGFARDGDFNVYAGGQAVRRAVGD